MVTDVFGKLGEIIPSFVYSRHNQRHSFSGRSNADATIRRSITKLHKGKIVSSMKVYEADKASSTVSVC